MQHVPCCFRAGFCIEYSADLAHEVGDVMSEFFCYVCILFGVVAQVSETLDIFTRCSKICCYVGYIVSFFLMCDYIVRDVERGCVDA